MKFQEFSTLLNSVKKEFGADRFFNPVHSFNLKISFGHTTNFYGKPFLPRANSSKICIGKFISGFVLPR